MSDLFIKPSVGLWFGSVNGNKDKDKKETKGHGGLVLGNWVIQLGVLAGSVVGFGKKWGLYTGLMGAVALIPLLGIGFLGLPVGVHYKRKYGLGLILPLHTEYSSLVYAIIAIVLYLIGVKYGKE